VGNHLNRFEKSYCYCEKAPYFSAQEITFINFCKVGFRVRSNMMDLMSDYYR